jgi:hypothetical protein
MSEHRPDNAPKLIALTETYLRHTERALVSRSMSYTTAEGREQILGDLAVAIEQIAEALAALGEAYELLDERAGDVLEEKLFRPVQSAYGRARRTHSEFAARSGLRTRTFEPHSPGPANQSVQSLIERAVDGVHDADQSIAELQDSLLPVEVGDTELRAGLSSVRETLSTVSLRARDLVRTVGR